MVEEKLGRHGKIGKSEERIIHKCSNCEKEINTCAWCRDYFESGYNVLCDTNWKHYHPECYLDMMSEDEYEEV